MTGSSTTMDREGAMGVEEFVVSRDGTRLLVRRWSPEHEARGVIAIVPGFSDHGGRYPHLVEFARRQGLAAAAVDTRGHGKSDGLRGHVTRFADFFDDADALVGSVRSAFPGRPIYLWGHSMGGLILLGYLSDGRGQGIRAATVTAPALKITVPVPVWKDTLARTLVGLWPTLPFKSPIDADSLSRDLEVGRRYLADPLVHGVCTPSLYAAMQCQARALLDRPRDFGIPTFFAHGLGDRAISVDGTRSYFERSPLERKALRLYPDARHELHNDPIHDVVFQDALRFFEEH